MPNILDKFITETALQLEFDEELVEKVINYKYKTIYEHLSTDRNIEDSGLAKFKVRPYTVKKRIAKLERYINCWQKKLELEPEEKKQRTLNNYIRQATADIEYLKTKIDED